VPNETLLDASLRHRLRRLTSDEHVTYTSAFAEALRKLPVTPARSA
jgi:hypothetical protein